MVEVIKATGSIDGSKPRVLSVEDDEDNAYVTSLLLQMSGYEVTSAATIADALRLSTDHPFDLFLIDRSLPDGDGLELFKQLRASGFQTPTIFYSAHAYTRDIKQGLDAGANAYLTKPVENEELLATIRKLLERELRLPILQCE